VTRGNTLSIRKPSQNLKAKVIPEPGKSGGAFFNLVKKKIIEESRDFATLPGLIRAREVETRILNRQAKRYNDSLSCFEIENEEEQKLNKKNTIFSQTNGR
jgi:hypothetical protein